MSELLKKQNYGVEVEFTGISRKMAADAVAEIIGTTASRPDHTCYQTRTIQDSQGRKWKVMRDSSINPIRKVGTENMDEYRVEFVTPVLKYEDLDTLQAIIRKFREIGGVPHASCGIHIHVDGANHTATSLRRLVNFMYTTTGSPSTHTISTRSPGFNLGITTLWLCDPVPLLCPPCVPPDTLVDRLAKSLQTE